MKAQNLYLFISVVGFVLPYSQLIPFLMEHGLNFSLLLQQLFANRISSFFGLDVIVSAVVTLILVINEKKRLGKYWYLPIIGTCTVGVSFGLPFYLFLKEINKDK